MLKRLIRGSLRAWGRWGRAPGYRYQFIDRYGAKLAADRNLPARLPNGCVMQCDLRDHVQRQIWFNGAYEPIESYLFSRLLKPGMTVVDAGANVGQYSLIAATAVGATGVVHSFEPVPGTFARLQQHVADNKLNGIVRPNQLALWHEDGPLNLGLARNQADNLGSYTIGESGGEVTTRGIRLATYARTEGLNRLDVIKMDIEGAEPFALAGGLDLIREFRPVILLEVNREALVKLGSSPESLWELVAPLGYQSWRIGSTPELCGPVANFDRMTQENVLLHHDPLPDTVTGGWTHRQVMRWARTNL